MKEIQCIQGSPEWFAYRKGRPTGSEFGRIVTPAKGEIAKGGDAYAAELVAESIGWYKSEFKGSPDTERGNRLEKEALRWLRMHHGIATRQVGFLLSDCGRYGCSPDAIAEDGCPVEVKAPDVHTFIKWHIAGGLPDDHKAQIHGEMILAGASKCYFVAYPDNPYLEPKFITVHRDEFTAKLEAALPVFCDRLDQLRRELTGDEYDVLFPANVVLSGRDRERHSESPQTL